jgi:WD40 repeat protein
MEEGGQRFEVHSLQLSNDGILAAVVWNGIKPAKSGKGFQNAGEQRIDLRDVKTGEVLKTLLGGGIPGYESGFWAGYVGNPSFSSDGKFVAVPLAYDEGGSKTVIWDTRSGSVRGQITFTCGLPRDTAGNYSLNRIGTPATVAFSPDSRYLAVARDDGSIYLYSLRSFLPVEELCSPYEKNPNNSSELIYPIQNLVFGPDGKELYGTPFGSSLVLKYDVPSVSS